MINVSTQNLTEASKLAESTVNNGLLLRTDLHTLFDLGLLGIEPTTFSIMVHESIEEPEYRTLQGKRIRLPETAGDKPSFENLTQKWKEFKANSPT